MCGSVCVGVWSIHSKCGSRLAENWLYLYYQGQWSRDSVCVCLWTAWIDLVRKVVSKASSKRITVFQRPSSIIVTEVRLLLQRVRESFPGRMVNNGAVLGYQRGSRTAQCALVWRGQPMRWTLCLCDVRMCFVKKNPAC